MQSGVTTSVESRQTWAETLRHCHSAVAKASGAACKVFLALQMFADSEGYCWPLVATLQNRTNIRRDVTIYKALRELESIGVLRRRNLISQKTGQLGPNLYRIGGQKIEGLPKKARALYLLGPERSSKTLENLSQKSSSKIDDITGKRSHGLPTSGNRNCESSAATSAREYAGNLSHTAKIAGLSDTAKSDAIGTASIGVQNYPNELPKLDKGDAVTHIALNHHFSPNTQLNRDFDADSQRVRQKALLQFQKEYTHIDADALNVAMDIIDARATGRVVSPQFYLKSLEQFFISTRDERALEIELAVIADQKKTRQEKIDIWAGKVAHGDPALMDQARAAVAPLVNENGDIKNLEGFLHLLIKSRVYAR